jgi:hypothetical protein
MALKHALFLSLIAAAVTVFGALVYLHPPSFLVKRAEAAPVTSVPSKLPSPGRTGAVPDKTGTPAPDRSASAPAPTENCSPQPDQTAFSPTEASARKATGRPTPVFTATPAGISPTPGPSSDADWLRQDNARRISSLRNQAQAELDEYNQIEQDYENALLKNGGGGNSWLYNQYHMDDVYAAQETLTARIERLDELAERNGAADSDELSAIGEEIAEMEKERA